MDTGEAVAVEEWRAAVEVGVEHRLRGAVAEAGDDVPIGGVARDDDRVILDGVADARWSRTNNNRDVSTGPLASPFARTAHSFAYSGLLASLAPSAALTRSLAPLTLLTPSLVG